MVVTLLHGETSVRAGGGILLEVTSVGATTSTGARSEFGGLPVQWLTELQLKLMGVVAELKRFIRMWCAYLGITY